ncbi:IclR family transcriptional regulator [Pusillimonas sp. ANT_WB101]|uniref:IclR family transcriptional regulator n=1 Tax=Pusillimonas sp. ANT_WB101 TaxID=2597356 RepID=UPI0011EE259A|nr:IclR family transcriptional regulator [Pusillimonas sp. ANT_WB101]KAA0892769.1 IclR family transcriptional regulator [Pusillimonas sp. ANT_WB101]
MNPNSDRLPPSTPQGDTATRYNAPALEKGLDILEALSGSSEGYTLNQLAKAMDRNVSQIFRMVVVMQRRGYIQADDNDRYTLTLKMLRLAHQQPPIKRITQAALPLLNELSERTRQSCHLAVYEQGRMVVVAQVDSPERWSFGLKLGSLMGLTDTSSGHVLLSYQDEIGRSRMLNDHIKIEGELEMDPGHLFSLLADVRRVGHSVMPSIQIQGVTNVAFPVRGLGQQVVAAINVPYVARIDGGPCPSIEQVKLVQMDICRRLSHQLGADDTSEA